MSAVRKRFWKSASAEPREEGFAVLLDGRPIRTPAGAPVLAPTEALARAAADEWDAQEDSVDPSAMPVTRALNSAIDRVAPNREAVAAMIAEYGGSDLLCYRAPHPDPLVRRQSEGWDPLLDWARTRYGAPLICVSGVMHQAQPEASVAALAEAVGACDAFRLTALHDLVTISGSLVLGLAVAERRLEADEAYALSRIDEDFQAELWGQDAEAAEAAERKRADFRAAARFLSLLGD